MKKAVVFAAVSMLAASASSPAAALLEFTASPTSPNLPEFIWTNQATPRLTAGPGAVGNDDGSQPPSQQTPGGLEIQTPLSITAPGSHALAGGGTEVDDVTLFLTNFAANGPASNLGDNVLVQQFGPIDADSLSTFTLISDSDDGDAGDVLLSGIVTRGSITALDGQDSVSVLSANVTYTGGIIFDALLAAGGPTTGSLSWSLLDATNLLDGSSSITVNPSTGFLVPFSADGTGLFSTTAVPEPATAALTSLASLGLLARRRRVR